MGSCLKILGPALGSQPSCCRSRLPGCSHALPPTLLASLEAKLLLSRVLVFPSLIVAEAGHKATGQQGSRGEPRAASRGLCHSHPVADLCSAPCVGLVHFHGTLGACSASPLLHQRARDWSRLHPTHMSPCAHQSWTWCLGVFTFLVRSPSPGPLAMPWEAGSVQPAAGAQTPPGAGGK